MGRPTGASRSTWAPTVSPSTTPKVLESPGAQPLAVVAAGFRDIFTWTETVSNVGRRLLQQWAVALGARPDIFDEAFAEPATLTKLVRYPGTDDLSQGVGRTGTRVC